MISCDHGAVFLAVLGIVNVWLSIFSARTEASRAGSADDCDVLASLAFCFTGCLNIASAFIRRDRTDAFSLFLNAAFLTAGCFNITTAGRIMKAHRNRTAQEAVLPVYATRGDGSVVRLGRGASMPGNTSIPERDEKDEKLMTETCGKVEGRH